MYILNLGQNRHCPLVCCNFIEVSNFLSIDICVGQKFRKILKCACLLCIYHMTEAVQTVRGSITVVSVLTCCPLLQFRFLLSFF